MKVQQNNVIYKKTASISVTLLSLFFALKNFITISLVFSFWLCWYFVCCFYVYSGRYWDCKQLPGTQGFRASFYRIYCLLQELKPCFIPSSHNKRFKTCLIWFHHICQNNGSCHFFNLLLPGSFIL